MICPLIAKSILNKRTVGTDIGLSLNSVLILFIKKWIGHDFQLKANRIQLLTDREALLVALGKLEKIWLKKGSKNNLSLIHI